MRRVSVEITCIVSFNNVIGAAMVQYRDWYEYKILYTRNYRMAITSLSIASGVVVLAQRFTTLPSLSMSH